MHHRPQTSPVPEHWVPRGTNPTPAGDLEERCAPCSEVGGGVGAGCELTSNLQPDLRRGVAQLAGGLAGVDASIPLLGRGDPERPGAGVLGGQNDFTTPWGRDERESGKDPQSPRATS